MHCGQSSYTKTGGSGIQNSIDQYRSKPHVTTPRTAYEGRRATRVKALVKYCRFRDRFHSTRFVVEGNVRQPHRMTYLVGADESGGGVHRLSPLHIGTFLDSRLISASNYIPFSACPRECGLQHLRHCHSSEWWTCIRQKIVCSLYRDFRQVPYNL